MESLANTIELQKRRMGVYEVDEEKEETTLEQMMKDLNETTNKYHEESKIFYKRVDKELEELKVLLKYTLSEQEKQRIKSMSMAELLEEIKKNVGDINNNIDTLIERWG